MEYCPDHPIIQYIERTGYPADTKEPQMVSVCEGCLELILEGEDMIEFQDAHLHDDSRCILEFIREGGVRKVAGA